MVSFRWYGGSSERNVIGSALEFLAHRDRRHLDTRRDPVFAASLDAVALRCVEWLGVRSLTPNDVAVSVGVTEQGVRRDGRKCHRLRF